jgi:hypothetical protein
VDGVFVAGAEEAGQDVSAPASGKSRVVELLVLEQRQERQAAGSDGDGFYWRFLRTGAPGRSVGTYETPVTPIPAPL